MNEQTTCTQIVDDGARVCDGQITTDVTWIDPLHRKDTIHNLVCDDCANWLMGLGASHLQPTRNALAMAK